MTAMKAGFDCTFCGHQPLPSDGTKRIDGFDVYSCRCGAAGVVETDDPKHWPLKNVEARLAATLGIEPASAEVRRGSFEVNKQKCGSVWARKRR